METYPLNTGDFCHTFNEFRYISATAEIYATALAEVLENAEDYYATATMDLSLSYSDGAWKMKTSPALFKALMGGV